MAAPALAATPPLLQVPGHLDRERHPDSLARLAEFAYVLGLFDACLGGSALNPKNITWPLVVGVCALCFISAAGGSAASKHFGTSNYTISYADFISVLLTAVSLLVTLLGFVMAIFAFIGWNSISSKVASDVKSYLNDGFQDGQPLHKMLRAELRAEKTKVMYEGVLKVDYEFEQDAAAEEEVDGNER